MNDTQETIQQKLKDYYVDNNEVEYWPLIVGLTNIYGKSEKDNTGECFMDNDKYILLNDLEQILIKLLTQQGFDWLMDILDQEVPVIRWYYNPNVGEAYMSLI